jgi:hypothetical protein
MMAKIYERSSGVSCWLGEHDKYVDLAFDTLEELSWASKALICQYCTQKLNIPTNKLTWQLLAALIEYELSATGPRAMCPFKDLGRATSPQRYGVFRGAMEDFIPGQFVAHSSLSSFALRTWGREESFAENVVSGSQKLSQHPSFGARMEALRQVFQYRSYWKRLLGYSRVSPATQSSSQMWETSNRSPSAYFHWLH